MNEGVVQSALEKGNIFQHFRLEIIQFYGQNTKFCFQIQNNKKAEQLRSSITEKMWELASSSSLFFNSSEYGRTELPTDKV